MLMTQRTRGRRRAPACIPRWIAVALLAGVGCGSAPDGDVARRSFSLGVIPGAQDFVLYVLESEGLFEKYDLHPDVVKMLSPTSLHLMLAEGQVDVGFGGFTTMAIARSQGKDVITVQGVFSPANLVFVPHESALRSLDDLAGRKLGIFGGPGSTTFTFLAVIAKQWYGLDLFNDVELVTAPGPALANLLDRGEIDAALMGTTESLRFSAEGAYRVLSDLSDEYRTRQGRAPAHVTVTTNEQFAAARGDLLRDFLKAHRDAVAIARRDDTIWARYGETIGMTDDAAVATLETSMRANLVDRWDAEQIAIQEEYLAFARSIVGDSVFGPPSDGLIRNDFVPSKPR